MFGYGCEIAQALDADPRENPHIKLLLVVVLVVVKNINGLHITSSASSPLPYRNYS